MSLLIYTSIALAGIGISGLGLAIQKTSLNLMGLVSLLLGTFIAILAVLLATLFLETYPSFLVIFALI